MCVWCSRNQRILKLYFANNNIGPGIRNTTEVTYKCIRMARYAYAHIRTYVLLEELPPACMIHTAREYNRE